MSAAVEDDIQREYNRQRDYLERTVDSLKLKLNKDTERHRRDHNKIVSENVALIKEINELRRDLKAAKATRREMETKSPSKKAGGNGAVSPNLKRELDIQRQLIS